MTQFGKTKKCGSRERVDRVCRISIIEWKPRRYELPAQMSSRYAPASSIGYT